MLPKLLTSIFGSRNDRLLKQYRTVVQKINALGGGAMPLAANTNLLSVNFSLAGAKIDDAALESLKGVSEQLVWLNLANTSVSDAGLKVLSGFKNPRRLHLE